MAGNAITQGVPIRRLRNYCMNCHIEDDQLRVLVVRVGRRKEIGAASLLLFYSYFGGIRRSPFGCFAVMMLSGLWTALLIVYAIRFLETVE
jgi:hypothetical protein